MATPQTNIADTGSSRYPRSRFHSKSAWENVTSIEGETIKKPAEGVATASVELPPEDLSDEQAELPDRRLTQSELYPVRQAFSPDHITALRLLTLAVGRSRRAIQHVENDDILAADTEIQKLQVLLPDLFCCRSLGDGFGTIINSLVSSFEGLDGDTPNAAQIRVMNKTLVLLRDKPFLTADEADEQLSSLEGVGLNPYPAELLRFLSSE